MIKENQLIQRVLVYIFGLFVLAFGVAFAINSDLGVSPVNSLPYIISLITGFRMGMCVFAMFALFILLQIVILRKEFKWINLAQLIFAFIFGYFVDITRLILGEFFLPTYLGQLVMLGISIVLIACGIILFMDAKLINLPPEGLMAAITLKKPSWPFHRVKIAVDSAFVTTAILLSFIFLSAIYGVREGTVLSAILIGKIMPLVRKVISPIMGKILDNGKDVKA